MVILRPELLDSARTKPHHKYRKRRPLEGTITDRQHRNRLAIATALGISVDELKRQGREDNARRLLARSSKEAA